MLLNFSINFQWNISLPCISHGAWLELIAVLFNKEDGNRAARWKFNVDENVYQDGTGLTAKSFCTLFASRLVFLVIGPTQQIRKSVQMLQSLSKLKRLKKILFSDCGCYKVGVQPICGGGLYTGFYGTSRKSHHSLIVITFYSWNFTILLCSGIYIQNICNSCVLDSSTSSGSIQRTKGLHPSYFTQQAPKQIDRYCYQSLACSFVERSSHNHVEG